MLWQHCPVIYCTQIASFTHCTCTGFNVYLVPNSLLLTNVINMYFTAYTSLV